MEIKKKVKNFIKYCNCISEFDKYFWIDKLDDFDESTLHSIYKILLESENKLLYLELNSIYKIKNLIEESYPSMQKDFLPDYESLMHDYEITQKELSLEKIKDIRVKLKQIINKSNV